MTKRKYSSERLYDGYRVVQPDTPPVWKPIAQNSIHQGREQELHALLLSLEEQEQVQDQQELDLGIVDEDQQELDFGLVDEESASMTEEDSTSSSDNDVTEPEPLLFSPPQTLRWSR
jgi:hypothetical protein